MTLGHLSIGEIRTKYLSWFGNRFELLGEEMEGEFSKLSVPRKAFNSGVRHFAKIVQESAKYIHAANSLAKETMNNKNRLREEESAREMQLVHKQALEEGEVFEFPTGTSLDFSGKCRLTEFDQMQIINKLREEFDCFRIGHVVKN